MCICEEDADRLYHRTQNIENVIRFELYSSSSTISLSLSKSLHTCTFFLIYPYLTYHEAPRVILIVISFFDEIPQSKQNSPTWDAAFCGVTSGVILFAFGPEKGPQAYMS